MGERLHFGFREKTLKAFVALTLTAGLVPVLAWAEPQTTSTSADLHKQPTGTLSLGSSAFSWSYGTDDVMPLDNDLLPTRYDLREQGLSTTMKNQRYLNSCWAFGALGSLESNMLVQRNGASLTSGSSEAALPDLSERHLGWFALEAQHDGSQKGEGVTVAEGTTSPDWGPIYHITATEVGQGIAALAAWEGAVDEETVPYRNNGGTSDPFDPTGSWSVDETLRFDSVVHLTDAECLPQPVSEAVDGSYVYSPASVEAVKQALYEEGAVSVSYYADASSPGQGSDPEYINYDTWATCVANVAAGVEHPESNHTVTIVGWDDTYPSSNFNSKHLPAGNGAWIVKNSWGDDWWGVPDEEGKNTGYFYLSYYDESASEFYRFSGDDGSDGFDYAHNYQYDYQSMGCSLTEPTATSTERATASVFTVDGAQTGAESLDAVSAVTMAPNATVDVRVYKLDDAAVDPTNGMLVARASETFTNTGYHTLKLGDEAVTLSAGQRFSVVETISSEAVDGNTWFHTAFEAAPADDATSQAVWAGFAPYAVNVVVNPGESWLYTAEGGWQDAVGLAPTTSEELPGGLVKTGNALIKAFTNDAESESADPTLAASYDLRDGGWVTPVRNQGATEVCWSFASMASLESSVLRGSGASLELSPFQAAYFATVGVEEREFQGVAPTVSDNPYKGGISPYVLAGSLAAGKGAAFLREGINDGPEAMPEDVRFASDVRLTSTAFVGTRAGSYWESTAGDVLRALVKRTVVEEGPVVAEFYSGNDFGNFNWTNSCYYAAPGTIGVAPDHYATIVGWDDDYSRYNFNDWMRPDGDGAWLVKNSWGTDWGKDGYGWISYEDASFAPEAALAGEQARDGERVYQKDAMGWSNSLALRNAGANGANAAEGAEIADVASVPTVAHAANVFTSERSETLDRVMFCTTGFDTSYAIEVYRGLSDSANPRSGELVSRQEGVEAMPGYHTVSLAAPVALSMGETFSVVLRVRNESYPYALAVETFTADVEEPSAVPAVMGRDARGGVEVSLVSADGVSWDNPAGHGANLAFSASRDYVTNVCVKALTMPRTVSASGAADRAKAVALAPTGDGVASAADIGIVALIACVALAFSTIARRRHFAR